MEKVTNAGTSTDGALSNEEIRDYQVLSQTELVDEMNKLSSETSEVLGFNDSICKALLHHFKWNKVTLIERFYEFPETSNTDSFFRNANLLNPTKHSKIEGKVDYCKICYELRRLTGLLCNHLFCRQCWSNWLSRNFLDESRPYATCPELRCTIIADDEFVLKTVDNEQALRSYHKLVLKSFVECNTLINWCPAPECGRAVKVPRSEPRKILCKCGCFFCFSCSQQWHEPISCHMLKKWQKKCIDDSEISNGESSECSLVSANTKNCPQCQWTTEKGGGCNHMTCKNSSCRFEFCWMCLGPWASHVSCNRYDDDATKRGRDSQERSSTELQRYLHYYSRFTNHQNSLKSERKLLEKVDEKIQIMQALGFRWIETKFLLKAVEILIECRRTLMYTYVFAFYLVQNNNITKIFVDNQSSLELATEQLSHYLERELPNEKGEVDEVKQKVQDKYRYVEQHRQNLLQHCVEGRERNEWEFCP
ncbi:hypothetical protein niasHT_010045 [Heterodera trifolii]|uniref:RBR-type E3 ubiquitin transferase n=1 Tax=Heterodera trifolii TaxID=157864 RepID=A0ABD2LYP7_9BILA